MMRQRFMVINYPSAIEKKIANLDGDGRFIDVIPIHEWLTSYHWSRLNGDFVLLLGDYQYQFHESILAHPKVEMLPSVSSMKKLGTVLKKADFWGALKANLNVDDEVTMDDILDLIEAKHGPIFGPIR